MTQKRDESRRFSRRALLKTGAWGALSGVVVAACGQPAPANAPAANTPQAPAATNPPAAAKPTTAAAAPQSTSQAAGAQAATGLTTDQISLLFMGHVAGGQNEQKAYDD